MAIPRITLTCLLLPTLTSLANAPDGTLLIDFNRVKDVTPIVYGFHYEEIGMIGEGGLHAEMVRNRALEEANMPRGLTVQGDRYAGIRGKPVGNKAVYKKDPLIGWETTSDSAGLFLTRSIDNPLNETNPHSLLVDVDLVSHDTALQNPGFYGMYFEKGNIYELSFYIRNESFKGELVIVLSDTDKEVFSKSLVLKELPAEWTKFTHTFKASNSTDRGALRFIPDGNGSFQLDMVSLFPGNTWDNGKSIFRSDIMENLADYSPDFIRFPGGCIVHGCSVGTQYFWKETIGPIEERPGAWSKWAPHYRTDGLGYHEFLELCEYLDADAMFVIPTGMICTGWVPRGEDGNHIHPDVDVDAFVQDALDAIEYAIGPVDSQWGAKRAENGHPSRFPLKYIEIGNEDFGPTYWKRHDKFFNAIRSSYPQIKLITDSRIFKDFDDKRSELPNFNNPELIEIFDEHYYKDMPWVFNSYRKFDRYERPSPDIFIGELGIGGPWPKNILAEGIINMYLERNADLNPMVADRPLMRNWNFEAPDKPRPVMLYHTNSISFKTFNFHLSKLFRDNKIGQYIESRWMPANEDAKIGYDHLFSSAGIERRSNTFILKLINLKDQPVEIQLGMGEISREVTAQVTALTAKPNQYSTPQNPEAATPITSIEKIPANGTYTVGPRSLTIIRIAVVELRRSE